tara:strand:+ start:2515 stop:3369 length:855 start_codon:yes stop_codon:yes gene_type:complete
LLTIKLKVDLKTLMSSLFNLKPCKNDIGAFIETDLRKVEYANIIAIRKAVRKYGAVFFRNQNLDSKNYVKFAKKIGKCASYPRLRGLEGFPEITVVEKKADEELMFGEGWHTDSTYTKNPPEFTMLYSIKTPQKGKGNTKFASQYASYENLSKDYKEKINNLSALFSADGPISKTVINRTEERGRDIDPKSLSAIHSIVRTNNENSKKSIYLSPGHVIKITDVLESEGTSILNYLTAHQVKPEFVYEFEWEPDCLALWSNYAMLHSPVNDFTGLERIMHRITIK